MQYFGLSRKLKRKESVFKFPEKLVVCLVTEVDSENITELSLCSGKQLIIGNHIVSTGECDNITVYEPFKDLNSALDFASEKFGAVTFISPCYDF